MKNSKMSISSRAKSFVYACSGFISLLKQEPNTRIHALATVVVIVLGIIQHLTRSEWAAIAIAIGLVWITEAVNTAIENLCDMHTTDYHPTIKIIKDISAFAVLMAALTSVVIGV